ncbi:MAG TPA: efflux RND transporter periplasmic adaptor subunit [Aquabacterium sp.]|uniref:efflux RND transporter periplasmic adaptor subunit n=1 Tax=Aquabacterium sp. TaxID=1872578 RepID=UPI002E34550A|nr:efflux RND transporter periplasmic adaptor subunit [Aquabacterium sp.]HEX5372598.1 efflux RND transporter periplasmic adaptor subunit [Aquabacterium sp.]
MNIACWLVSAALLGACGKQGAAPDAAASRASQAQARPSITVQTVTPQTRLWPVSVSAHGSIAPWQETLIGAEVGGLRVMDVLVNVGDTVQQGQVLALLRTDALQSDLAAARASWTQALALLAEARANADRARQLQSSDAISSQEAQRALTAEQTAQAQVDALKAQMAATELRVSQSRVVATDSGVISARLATVGAVVQPGQELFRLIRQQRLEWRAEVPATDLHRLRAGQQARVLGPSGQSVTARVRMVAPTVDAATRNGLVYVDLPVAAAQAAGLRSGMFSGGQFDVGQVQGLTLPQTAVLLRDGFSYVFTVGAGNKVMQVKVSTGRRVGDRVEITQGLSADTRVVASGVGFLDEGDTVRVVQGAAPASAPASAR